MVLFNSYDNNKILEWVVVCIFDALAGVFLITPIVLRICFGWSLLGTFKNADKDPFSDLIK